MLRDIHLSTSRAWILLRHVYDLFVVKYTAGSFETHRLVFFLGSALPFFLQLRIDIVISLVAWINALYNVAIGH